MISDVLWCQHWKPWYPLKCSLYETHVTTCQVSPGLETASVLLTELSCWCGVLWLMPLLRITKWNKNSSFIWRCQNSKATDWFLSPSFIMDCKGKRVDCFSLSQSLLTILIQNLDLRGNLFSIYSIFLQLILYISVCVYIYIYKCCCFLKKLWFYLVLSTNLNLQLDLSFWWRKWSGKQWQTLNYGLLFTEKCFHYIW